MFTILLQQFYGATDLFVVGHFATTSDVVAVSIGSQIMMMLTHMILGLTTGTTVLLGQYFGAKNEERLSKTVGGAVPLFASIAIIATIAMLFLCSKIVSLMNTPTQAIDVTRSYITICSSGLVFIIGYNVISAIMRGLGDSKSPMIFVAVACVINVVLDLVFVCNFGMGASGTALATVIAQFGSLAFAIIFLRRRGIGFKFHTHDIRFERKTTRDTLVIGSPLALQNILVSISFLFITLIINRMGLVASASAGVVEKLIGFLMLPSIAFSAAVSTMAAQNIGAGQFARAKKSMWAGIRISLCCAIVVCTYSQFFGETLTRLLTADQAVITMAAEFIRTYSIDCIMVAFVFCMNGFFNANCHSMFSMTHSIISTFAGRIPLAIFFSGLPGATMLTIGFAAPASTLISIILCFFFLRYLSISDRKIANNPAFNGNN